MEDLIGFLELGDKGTNEFREEFGRYPRKNLHLLLESGIVEKFKINRLVRWRIVEGTLIRQEDGELKDFKPVTEIEKKFEDFVSTVDSEPLSEEMTVKLDELKTELNKVADEVVNVIPKKKFRLFGRRKQ